ncbi:hypothetical protein ACFLZ1_00375 [Patescibacteria group bacterium]
MINTISNWRKKKQEYQYLGKIGKIISFTKISNPPKGFGKLPYYVAILEFKNKEKKTGQLVLEGKMPKIGAKALAILRIVGIAKRNEIINYGIKFKLL